MRPLEIKKDIYWVGVVDWNVRNFHGHTYATKRGTAIPGIFAAGDVTDVPEKQIIIAAGEGAKACLSAFRYLAQH